MAETKHPLESEDLDIAVTITHVQSGQETTIRLSAGVTNRPTGMPRTLSVEYRVKEATQAALDGLLTKLEVQGGG